MDYLERLDNALESLEAEADKLTGLSKLSVTLGEVADELSAEKRQIKDAIQELNIAKTSIDNNTKELVKNYHEADESARKRFEAVNEAFAATARDREVKKELIDRKIENSQRAVEETISTKEKELNEVIKETSGELEQSIEYAADKIDTKINAEHEFLKSKVEILSEEIDSMKNQIDEFRLSAEKTGKVQTALISVAALLSLVACCLMAFN